MVTLAVVDGGVATRVLLTIIFYFRDERGDEDGEVDSDKESDGAVEDNFLGCNFIVLLV